MFGNYRTGYFMVSLRLLLVALVALGVVYPLTITGLSTLFFNNQASGSQLIDDQGMSRGSSLLAQKFTNELGAPLPQYFQPRPSAASWDALASSGSNLGPNSEELMDEVRNRTSQFTVLNSADSAPVDSVTASGSGLDPHISWENAQAQMTRVAQARGLTVEQVQALVAQAATQNVDSKIAVRLVNTTTLNFELDQLDSADPQSAR